MNARGNDIEPVTIFQFVTGTVWTKGVGALLNAPLGFTVVGDANSVREGLPMIEKLRPQVIMCGYRPENYSPAELVAGLREMGLRIPVLVLTTHAEPGVIREVLRTPVDGYLVAGETTPEQLAQAVMSVFRGLAAYGPTAQRVIAESIPQETSMGVGPLEGLTPREREVLNLIVQGMGNREIATALSVSLRTVQLHTSHLLAKLGAHSRLEAAVRSLQIKGPLSP